MSATDNDSTISDEDRAYLIRSKLLSMLILGGCSAVSGLTPLILSSVFRKSINNDGDRCHPIENGNNAKGNSSSNSVRKFDTYEKILSYGLLFGGGVLLSTVFLHLLPELTESIEKLEEDKIIDRTPISYPEMLMCFGFFLMFTIEELVRDCLVDKSSSNKRATVLPSSSSSSTFRPDDGDKNINGNGGISNQSFVVGDDPTISTATNISNENDCYYSRDENELVAKDSRIKYKNYSSCTNNNNNNSNNDYDHSHVHDVSPSLRNFLIVLALSVHEIFEGLAVGLERYPHLVWALLTAVMCHKLVLAGCVGLQLAGSRTDTDRHRQWIDYLYVIFFAMTSPIGIAAGTFLAANAAHENAPFRMISAVLQGIATGTLLYIIFFEILKEHRHQFQIRGLARVLCLLLGFAFMVTLQVCLSEDD